MTLLLFSNPLTCLSSLSSSLSPSSSSTSALTATPVSRLHLKPIDLHTKSFNGVQFQNPILGNRLGAIVVKASSSSSSPDIDGTSPPTDSNAESKKEVVPVDKLPLESKLQERMDQKMKMTLAKKIRLRKKRLVRKRKMRKKGRWPPSKMKKLKNV